MSRRVALQSTALVSGALLLTSCKDDQPGSGTPGAVDPGSKNDPGGQDTPTVDPAVVAALSTAATVVNNLVNQYASTGTKYPALKPKLAAGAKYHAAHLAKLTETAGVTTAKVAPKAVPSTSTAALSALSVAERAASEAHAVAAAKASGSTARTLAMLAASELQLALSLVPAKKVSS
nr:cell division protein FtsK [Kribbella sandramycini]